MRCNCFDVHDLQSKFITSLLTIIRKIGQAENL